MIQVVEVYGKGIYITINCTNFIIPVVNSIVIGLLYAVIAIFKNIMQHNVVLKKLNQHIFNILTYVDIPNIVNANINT